ncbi:putative mitochondrial hypothetical protein [Leptomonas pyrrhocoris]|uniref:Uncharacterized protein n=1 Tax=Leptomonas pyrrhocoris TaxID=157538 RepID=A0A0N0VE98_LEPPY|nr:putative mitochondrial hypothetical protein [Leptomonas pyrrhocoris]KPA77771.1 putative mitochondrial hypothetical protein [Leptomonas pyrrhocoris]|eukprot:XP_015656210.1 putative mitochondrial hypothetical protein [Leptomonas pyrrhocoris]
MRRGVAAAQATAAACVWAGRRSLHRHHSPDRTFSQEIQDRQNAFRWSNRHVFRPHQHFSYDPSNWSRTLEAKALQQHTLSLVERVKRTQEHAAERRANGAAMQQMSECASEPPTDPCVTTTDDDDVPSYFFSSTDTTAPSTSPPSDDVAAPHNSWEAVSLQELVDELQRLQQLLYSRRYAANASLARRTRQEEEHRIILLHLLERLSGAVLEETVTVDACAFGWFTLLRHVEPLVDAMVSAAQPMVTTQEAVQRVFVALQQGLLLPMTEGGVVYTSAAGGALSLEALVELLSVAASPFVRNCSDIFHVPAVPRIALEAYAEWISTAAHQRAREADDDDAEGSSALREWVAPTHLEAWATALRHLHHRGSAVGHLWPGLSLHVEHAALYVTRTLKSVTGVNLRGRVKESLQRSVRPSAQRASPEEDEEASGEPARVREPKAVVLDATAPPRGVQVAPTACDDVSRVLAASTAALQIVSELDGDVAAVSDERMLRPVTSCLLMTAQAPNYDLEGGVVVQWACTLLHTGALMLATSDTTTDAADNESRCGVHEALQRGGEDGVRLSLRFVLLLSRLSFHDVVDRPALGRLALLLSQWPLPACSAAKERAEWRRLRGLVMKALLDRLTCEDLAAAAAKVDGVSTWVETLAFGEYDGVVPLELWRAACQQWLPSHNSPISTPSAASSSSVPPACSPDVAHALLLLCARYIAREEASNVSAVANLHSLPIAERVAEGVQVFLHGRPGTTTALLQSADTWDAIQNEMPATLHALIGAMQAVVRREAAQAKVMHF